MIVSEVMTTQLVTITPDDTLSHAASLMRQYQFHHLPVVRTSGRQSTWKTQQGTENLELVLEGLLTSQNIDMVVAAGTASDSEKVHLPWQERRVAEVMRRDIIRISPMTSVAAAAQLLVERDLNCLPIVEDASTGQKEPNSEAQEAQAVLVGLLTRSDLLLALARSMGAFEPGMDLVLPLPTGDLTPLGKMLLLAAELHIPVHSILAAPMQSKIPRAATVRLATINPTPLLVRLQQAHIQYTFTDVQSEGDSHV